MSAHTPGPWSVWPGFGPAPLTVTDDRFARHLALIQPQDHEANARLIAAAPDLLARVKRGVERCTCTLNETRWPNGCPDCEADRAAIQRAEETAP